MWLRSKCTPVCLDMRSTAGDCGKVRRLYAGIYPGYAIIADHADALAGWEMRGDRSLSRRRIKSIALRWTEAVPVHLV